MDPALGAAVSDRSIEGKILHDGGRSLEDDEIVRRICAGEHDLFEQLLRRYNQRLYRLARAVLKSDGDAEDVVQETWLRAFAHLTQLAEPARFAAWVSRIALYEAWARARRRNGNGGEWNHSAARVAQAPASGDPERTAADQEIQRVLEAAIDSLPEKYRLVLVLRGIEGLSAGEAARALNVSRVAVNTRFHRARALLRADLARRAGLLPRVFDFLGLRCQRMREHVMNRVPVRSTGC
jgi:RNA polymerase sigma-70 factor (ECF subfamily)